MRLFLRSTAAATLGYGLYISWFQAEAQRHIIHRQMLSHPDLDDPTKKYAVLRLHGKYLNPFLEYRHQTLFEFVFCRIQELFRSDPRGGVPSSKEELMASLASTTPNFEAISKTYAPHNQLSFTWIGQSCALLQFPRGKSEGHITVLTDPMFSESVVSPHLGPQRLIPAPCRPEDLPKLDYVLISHDHQDHMDFDAIKKIGNDPLWVVPLGVGSRLQKLGITNYREMSWWERQTLPGIAAESGYEIACTPSMHWSGRNLLDSNDTLWCSFVLLRNKKPLFFHAGDSGYAQGLFRGIGQVYGRGYSLAMVPCGAYLPRWHLKSHHMDPLEAVSVMDDIGAENGVGVHWGTFVMSDEPYTEPPIELLAQAAATNTKTLVQAPKFGETLLFPVN